jgi:hypothetical protein
MRPIYALVAILVAFMVIGEVYIYTLNNSEYYSATFTADSEGVTYRVASNGSDEYSVVVMDSGSFRSCESVYIYYDESYATNYNKNVFQPIGSKTLDQNYYLTQLKEQLGYRGVNNDDLSNNASAIVFVNATELEVALKSDISNSSCNKGLVVISGALPDTVYTGNSTDTVLSWIESGGTLYWAGSLIGSCYATKTELVDVSDYQMLFFGVECLNTGTTDIAHTEINDNGLRSSLSIMNNSVLYGVDTSKLTSENLAIGFSEGGYSSISLVKHGSGMICVFGGDYSNNQRADMAQVIASHVCYCSKIVGAASGVVTRGSVTGTVPIAISNGTYYECYVYYGGYYTVFGRSESILPSLMYV